MFGPKLTGSAHRIRPVELDLAPIANPDFLLKKTDNLTRFSFANQASPFGLAKTIGDFNPLPRRPEHHRLRILLEQIQCGWMLRIPAALVAQPPRGVRIQSQFCVKDRLLHFAPSSETVRSAAKATHK